MIDKQIPSIRSDKSSHFNEGQLLRYLDSAMDPKAVQDIQTHLAACSQCRALLDEVSLARSQVSGLLKTLAPVHVAQPQKALARLVIAQQVNRRPMMSVIEIIRNSRSLQRGLVGGGVLLALVGSLAFAPVRALASNLLGVFRVERFAIVDVDPERLEAIDSIIENGDFVFGDEEVLQDGGEPVEAGSVDEAEDLAGFDVLVPAGYADATSILVTGESQSRFTPNLEDMQVLFAELGLEEDLLPEEIDGQPFEITIPAGVLLAYGDPEEDSDALAISQFPSPSVDVPEGVDVEQLGIAMLQLLGMSPREAKRLSETIDWTTTLVVPVTDSDHIQEIQVNGTTGLLFESEGFWNEEEEEYVPGMQAVVWQHSGFVLSVMGNHETSELIEIAESLE